MKHLRLLLFCLLPTAYSCASTSIDSALVGIDGLTCSACSFSTQKSIMKLDFVDSVAMDLNKNLTKIYFKKGKKVNIQAIADKVKEAGFSVRSISASMNFSNAEVIDGTCYPTGGALYQFVGLNKPTTLNGTVTITFVGKDFVSKKAFKKWEPKIKSAAQCSMVMKKEDHYFVTL